MEDIKYIISKLPYIDFRPAKVKETNGDEWRIVFYVRKPGKNEMFRFRRRVQKIPGKRNRMRLAKRICADINKKLEGGWSPFIEGSGKDEYRRLYDVMGMFLDQCERRMRDSQFRPDSLRAYTSYVKNIKGYIELKGITEMFTAEFNKKFILGFLDYIYFEKKRSARTSNNYLGFCNVLASFMYDREYITTNPIYGIKKRKNSKKNEKLYQKLKGKPFLNTRETRTKII